MQLIKVYCMLVVPFLVIGCSTMQSYYIKQAKMVDVSDKLDPLTANRTEPVKRLLNGHYVKSGNNLVLLVRKFDKGDVFTIDDETYEKLTVEIKDYIIGEPIRLDSPNINFFYSSGSSGFVSKGHGVYSTSGMGNIIIKKIEKNSIDVEFDLTILTEPAGPFPFEGREVQVQETVSFKDKKLNELSPWLGMPDQSLGKEVYP